MARDYAAAWQTMAEALDQNRTDLLAANFIGTAGDKLTAGIQAQRKTDLHQRIVDKGHRVDVVFYSPEGSAMELHDTAQIELQVMDGSKVIHSEDATVHYVVLLTAAENSWKVRVLEAVPSFSRSEGTPELLQFGTTESRPVTISDNSAPTRHFSHAFSPASKYSVHYGKRCLRIYSLPLNLRQNGLK